MKTKRFVKAFALLLTVATVLATNAQSVFAITEITLSNKYGTVSEGDKKVNFKVELKNVGDSIEVYKIADMQWDSVKKTYVGPDWVLGISQDLTGAYAAFETPMDLGEANIEDQINFLNWIYDNRNTNNLEDSKITSKAELSSDKLYYTIKDADYGIYMIKAKNKATGKDYQLLTVNALPTQEGPNDSWYIRDDITASLKFSNVIVKKKINGEHGKTVETGETVHFTIVSEVPDYPGVEVPQEGAPSILDFSSYFFTMTDQMSVAFDDAGVTPVVEYAKEQDVWVTLPADKYDILFAKKAVDGTSNGVRVYNDTDPTIDKDHKLLCNATKVDDTYTFMWYAYVPSRGEITYLASSTGTSIPSTCGITEVKEKYENATGFASGDFSLTASGAWTDMRAVNFDYEYLHEEEAIQVRISYDAKVTTATSVGVDTNTNTATFYYQKDLSGNVGDAHDTAYAWTYALKVIKEDGNKPGTYLPNAKFNLFKEAYIFVPGEGVTGTNDYEHYVFSSSVTGETTAPVGKTTIAEDAPDVSLVNLKLMNDNVLSNYYFRDIEVEAGSCNVANCIETGESGEAHIHYLVYEIVTYKDANGDNQTEIVSTGDINGVKVSGLAPASYVLIETAAPAGFNKLQEAMRFEIQELTTDQAAALNIVTPDGTGSLRGFVSDIEYSAEEIAADATLTYLTVGSGGDAKHYRVFSDGTYEITVKNYAGIVLPSTGGIGTMLFTIIGIMIMAFAMVIILVKRKQATYE